MITLPSRRMFLAQAAAASLMSASGRVAWAASQTTVKFLFDVLPNPKHALFYPAQAKGFFRENGLAVTIEAGKGSADVVQKVASGAFDFGFADASAVILARSRDIAVKLVAMVHYTPLMTIVTRAEAGVAKPSDLMGKKIAATSGDSVRALAPAFARINHFDVDRIEFVTVDQAAKAALLLSGHVDGVCDYASAFPVYEAAAEKNGVKLKQLPYADFGLDIYSNGIVVLDETVSNHPQTVAAFTSAIIRSLKFAAGHRQEAVSIFRTFQPQYDADVVGAGLDIALAHLLTPEARTNGLGAMSSDKMAKTIAITKETYGLAHDVTAADVYTNAFIPKA